MAVMEQQNINAGKIANAFFDTIKLLLKIIKKIIVKIASFSMPLLIVLCLCATVILGVCSSNSSGNNNISTVSETAGEGSAEATIQYAKKYLGKNLAYFLANDNSGRFFHDHWCAMFCGYVLYNTNKDSFASKQFSASCLAWNQGLATKNKLHTKSSNYTPKMGDLIFFGSSGQEHIGLIESYNSKTKVMKTIEGNSGHGPYPDGSIVFEHTFTIGSGDYYDNWCYGFGEVEYKSNSSIRNKNFKDRHLRLPATGKATKLSDKERDLLLRNVYREAGGTSFECQVYCCSVTLNLWQESYSDWSLDKLVHNYGQFETAPTIDSVTEAEKKIVAPAVDYVLAGGRVAEIKYYRTDYYHHWSNGQPTPVTNIDNVYFSK
ncbi:MAG: CHAP domain-containing protein [Ruminococcus sp.]